MSDVPKTMVQTALISRVALLIENLTYPECGIPLDCKEWIEKLKSIAFILEEELSQSATALAQSQARVAELEKDAARYRWWHERWTGTDSQLDELNKLDWSFDRPESWTEAIDAALKDRA